VEKLATMNVNPNLQLRPLELSQAQMLEFGQIWYVEQMLELGENGKEFERYTGFLLSRWQFDVFTLPPSGDRGIDLYVRNWSDGKVAIVQCKQYSLKYTLRPEKFRELIGTLLLENNRTGVPVDYAILVTTTRASQKTHQDARSMGALLLDGPALEEAAIRTNGVPAFPRPPSASKSNRNGKTQAQKAVKIMEEREPDKDASGSGLRSALVFCGLCAVIFLLAFLLLLTR
jgi:hypothetical protein